MTYPAPFLRLVASGRLFGVEDWSVGLSLIPNFTSGPDAPPEVPQRIVDASQAFWTSNVFASTATLTTLKLNLIGPDGRYVGSDTVSHEYAVQLQGGGANILPPQIALVASLRSGARRGLAHAGRIFLPAPSVGISQSAGTTTDADARRVQAGVQTWLNEVNAALPQWRVGIASKVGAGQFRAVETVTVGIALDTVRSRRGKFVEKYVTPVDLAGGAG